MQSKAEKWLTAGVVAVGLPIAALVAFVAYVRNLPPLHPVAGQITSIPASASAPRWTSAVGGARERIRSEITTQDLPGISAAVGINGELVWAEGFGWANVETHAPVTPETKFRIGHVSKAITSAGVGVLLEKGRLDLDDTIQTAVPSFPVKEWPVTLRQLMGHTAGIRHYRDDEWGDKPSEHCDRAADGLRTFANDPLLFKPDTQYRYSTYGWVLVSAAVEAAAGVPFDEFMRASVFVPAGMTHTVGDAPREPMADRATSYFRGNLGREVTTGVDYSCFAGGGALLSTPSDLVRFGAAMMSGTFLRPETVKTLQTRQRLLSDVETGYGLGWTLETVELSGRETRMASHASRTIEGASTSFLTFPDLGIVVALSSNMSFADMRSIALAIAELFAKAAPAPATSRIPSDGRPSSSDSREIRRHERSPGPASRTGLPRR
jgi:CubicO group peptidase (beta-lactamase class C family)